MICVTSHWVRVFLGYLCGVQWDFRLGFNHLEWALIANTLPETSSINSKFIHLKENDPLGFQNLPHNFIIESIWLVCRWTGVKLEMSEREHAGSILPLQAGLRLCSLSSPPLPLPSAELFWCLQRVSHFPIFTVTLPFDRVSQNFKKKHKTKKRWKCYLFFILFEMTVNLAFLFVPHAHLHITRCHTYIQCTFLAQVSEHNDVFCYTVSYWVNTDSLVTYPYLNIFNACRDFPQYLRMC